LRASASGVDSLPAVTTEVQPASIPLTHPAGASARLTAPLELAADVLWLKRDGPSGLGHGESKIRKLRQQWRSVVRTRHHEERRTLRYTDTPSHERPDQRADRSVN